MRVVQVTLTKQPGQTLGLALGEPMHPNQSGTAIVKVAPDGVASAADIKEGDLIIAVSGETAVSLRVLLPLPLHISNSASPSFSHRLPLHLLSFISSFNRYHHFPSFLGPGHLDGLKVYMCMTIYPRHSPTLVRSPTRAIHPHSYDQCDAMRCDAMRCDAMRCDAMRCDAMQAGAWPERRTRTPSWDR